MADPMNHDDAIQALADCASTTTVLSYREAIEGYLKLRGMPFDQSTADTQALAAELRAFAAGCRRSMWQSRKDTIRLMDEAATALEHSQPLWRCFHCGAAFCSKGEARDHFGDDEGATPACKIKAGSEKGLLEALRKAERENAEAWQAVQSETIEAVKAMYGQASRHQQQLIAAEQAGYDKGLADGRGEALHPPPQPEES